MWISVFQILWRSFLFLSSGYLHGVLSEKIGNFIFPLILNLGTGLRWQLRFPGKMPTGEDTGSHQNRSQNGNRGSSAYCCGKWHPICSQYTQSLLTESVQPIMAKYTNIILLFFLQTLNTKLIPLGATIQIYLLCVESTANQMYTSLTTHQTCVTEILYNICQALVVLWIPYNVTEILYNTHHVQYLTDPHNESDIVLV